MYSNAARLPGGFRDSKASRIVVIGDARGGVGHTDQPIPCVVGGGAGDCGIWNADHVPGLIVADDPCGARRVVDRRDLVGLVAVRDSTRSHVPLPSVS